MANAKYTWAEAMTAAGTSDFASVLEWLGDNDGTSLYLPGGTYKLYKPAVIRSGLKIEGEKGASGRYKAKIENHITNLSNGSFNLIEFTAGKNGIENCLLDGRVTNAITSTRVPAIAVKFGNTNSSGNEDDVDSKFCNNSVQGFQERGGKTTKVIYYNGRNPNICNNAFSDINDSTLITLTWKGIEQDNSANGKDDDKRNSWRKNRIRENVFHVGASNQCIVIEGDYAIVGLLVQNNVSDLGAGLLRVLSGGVTGLVCTGNTVNGGGGTTVNGCRFDAGRITSATISGNCFVGYEDPYNTGNIWDEFASKYPTHCIYLASNVKNQGLTITGNTLGGNKEGVKIIQIGGSYNRANTTVVGNVCRNASSAVCGNNCSNGVTNIGFNVGVAYSQ